MNNVYEVENCEHRSAAIVPGPTGPARPDARGACTCQVHCPDCGFADAGDAYSPDTAWTRAYAQSPSLDGRVLQQALAEVLTHRGLPMSESRWNLPVTHAYAKGGGPGDPDYNCWRVALTCPAADKSDWTATVCLASGNSENAALEAAFNLAKYDSHPPLDGCIAAYHLGGIVCQGLATV